MKKIPKLQGIDLTLEEMYSKKLLRAGIKVNTPIVCNWSCPYCYAGSEEFKKISRISSCKEGEYNVDFKDKYWYKKIEKCINDLIKIGLKAITIN